MCVLRRRSVLINKASINPDWQSTDLATQLRMERPPRKAGAGPTTCPPCLHGLCSNPDAPLAATDVTAALAMHCKPVQSVIQHSKKPGLGFMHHEP